MVLARPLTLRLAARALVLAFDPDLSTSDQAVRLARLARGDPSALDGAARRIAAGPNGQGPLASQAIEALQVAAAILAVPPTRSPAGAGARDARTTA